MTKALITGGCGFFGHHAIERFLINTDWDLIVLDRLSYASNGFNRLREIDAFTNPRVQIFTADITQPIEDGLAYEIGQVDYIFHFAAETHVDNSITAPGSFIKANVLGTYQMLEFARHQVMLQRFFYFSTDEVFGPALNGAAFGEWDRYNSTNPYSATKAAGEELCLAWANTYSVPMVITHCMNLFGERQHGEKFIPSTIRKVLRCAPVIIHAHPDKKQAGSRFYLHARNAADAVLFIADRSDAMRDKFNIPGQVEMDNLALAQLIAEVVGKKLDYELVDFHSSRPGHDLRYGLDGTKIANMGWDPPVSFRESLVKTIEWSIRNIYWLEVSHGSYQRRGDGQGRIDASHQRVYVPRRRRHRAEGLQDSAVGKGEVRRQGRAA